MQSSLKTSLVVALLVVLSIGCAGPKISSSTRGYEIAWAKPASFNGLAVRLIPSDEAFRNGLAGQSIGEALTKAIEKEVQGVSCVKLVHSLVPFEAPADPVLLEVRVMRVYNANRAQRAQGFELSELSVAGRLVDTAHDNLISIWSKTRRGTGGLLGIGGFLVPSDEDLLQSLVEWVVEDVSAHVTAFCPNR